MDAAEEEEEEAEAEEEAEEAGVRPEAERRWGRTSSKDSISKRSFTLIRWARVKKQHMYTLPLGIVSAGYFRWDSWE